jgi:putative peptidoglycan lipid II flippase
VAGGPRAMNIIRATSVIGGLTLVSRLFGFARDMLLSRILGAGLAADAFFVAFRMPNLFRRLFAEGAFSAAYVPMFSRRLQEGGSGLAAARRFSEDVLSVFLPVLLLFTALLEIAMPAIVWLMASGYAEVPGKFELTVELTRIAFPYLLLISLVSLFSGVLNSMSRFAAAAAAPILFNAVLIAGVIVGAALRGDSGDDTVVARVMAVAISVSGLVQFAWLLVAMQRAGVSLRLRLPRLTPDVKQLGRIILPATFGAGIYQLSQFIDTFFATSLPQGSLAYLNYADRLNQLPLGVIGIALGTAILPTLSRHIARQDDASAQSIQSTAIELAMVLTLPAAAGLAVCAQPLVTAFYVGGRFTPADAQTTASVLAWLVAGLPAYVLLKVLTPGFFARSDTRTPVKVAAGVLVINVLLNFLLIGRFGIAGLAMATAVTSWLNCFTLYAILARRGHFRLTGAVVGRLLRQLAATLLMGFVLVYLRGWLEPLFAAGTIRRIVGLAVLIGTGGLVYVAAAFLLGAINKDLLAQLRRRRTARA